jgi:hypothetical protein
MEIKHTPAPWVLVQDEKWPFNLHIKHDGASILSVGRYAYSSSDKTPSDVMSARHFKGSENQENAAKMNKQQLADMTLIAITPEFLDALYSVPLDGFMHTMWAKNIISVIAKARGEK